MSEPDKKSIIQLLDDLAEKISALRELKEKQSEEKPNERRLRMLLTRQNRIYTRILENNQ